jgi:DNA repair protein RecO (recombination protein O)
VIAWTAEGTVLSARRHGETAAILEVLTRTRGRAAGLVHGGASRRMAATLQPGGQVALRWRARTEDALGTFAVEPVRSRAALLGDRLALAALSSTCSLAAFALPKRQAFPDLYDAMQTLLDALGEAGWPLAYLEWEVLVLERTGYRLDLARCAATGRTEGLAYVSPRTGRAVSEEGAGEWADRLLPLPPVLLGADADLAGIVRGLEVTGHFLENSLARAVGRPLPEPRRRLIDALDRAARREAGAT